MTRPALLALSIAVLFVAPLLGNAADLLRQRVAQAVLLGLVALVMIAVFPEVWEILGPMGVLIAFGITLFASVVGNVAIGPP